LIRFLLARLQFDFALPNSVGLLILHEIHQKWAAFVRKLQIVAKKTLYE